MLSVVCTHTLLLTREGGEIVSGRLSTQVTNIRTTNRTIQK